MPDTKPLSDAETGARLRKAASELGEAPGATMRADTALMVARNGLGLIPHTPMGDDQPLSDTQTAWRLYNALLALGTAPGATPEADRELTIARIGITTVGQCLISAGVRAEQERD